MPKFIKFSRSFTKTCALLFVCVAGVSYAQDTANAQANTPVKKKNGADSDKVKVELSLNGVSSTRDSNSSGTLIPLNDDFDEHNGVGDIPGIPFIKSNDLATGSSDKIVETDNELVSAHIVFEANTPTGGNKKIQQNPQGLNGKWSLEFSDYIKVWRKVGTSYQRVLSYGLSEEVSLPLTLDLKIEGVAINETAPPMTDDIEAKFTLNNNGGSGSATARYTVFKVNLSSSPNGVNLNEVDEETPGAPIMLNDDNDDNDVYPDVANPPAGVYTLTDYRPYEPVWDKDEIKYNEQENDLLPVTIDIKPRALGGNLVLKATGVGNNGTLRVWDDEKKGDSTHLISIPTSGKFYPVNDLGTEGKKIYVEGLKTGTSDITLAYTFKGITYDDILKTNVVSLEAKQIVVPIPGNDDIIGGNFKKVIYDYDTDIEFNVLGGSNSYWNLWDFDGDDRRGYTAVPYENPGTPGNTDATRLVKYAETASVNSVALSQIYSNKRKEYVVSVQLQPSGLILSRVVRVALSIQTYDPNTIPQPAQSNAGLKSLIDPDWNNDIPFKFDNVTDSGDNNQREQFQFTYVIPEANINDGDRLLYAINVGAPNPNGNWVEAKGLTLTSDLHIDLGEVKLWAVLIDDSCWREGWKRDELKSFIDHEKYHLYIADQVRKKLNNGVDDQANKAWRQIVTYVTGSQSLEFQEPACRQFAAISNAETPVDWLLLTLPAIKPDNTLGVADGNLFIYRFYYDQAVLRLSAIPQTVIIDGLAAPINTPRALARELLQKMYKDLPFEEMKRSDYDPNTSVRPPL